MLTSFFLCEKPGFQIEDLCPAGFIFAVNTEEDTLILRLHDTP